MSEHDFAYELNGQRVTRERFYAVACDPRRSVAVEACAGAGKTWMLVSRILRALLEGAQPHEILAITFTKKAAGEMRQRLHEWLAEFAEAPEHELRLALAQRGVQVEAGSDLPARLKALYAQLLASGRPVQIRTFHSWFAALLRTAPLATMEQMGLPARHELLENDKEAVALVWRRFYDAVANDAPLRLDYERSVATYGRTQTQKALASALNKRVEFTLADADGVLDASVRPWDEMFADLAGGATPDDLISLDGPVRSLLVEAARFLGRGPNVTATKAGSRLEMALSANDLPEAISALLTEKLTERKFSDKLAGLDTVKAA
ncbi:MAG TPA: UvrD-helicase domain-containing protein, partial [Ramlibacter sp.]|nr:UvrD-helicase domain-containing protein [Ramlibacter sp.]